MPDAPVQSIDPDDAAREPEPGTALCLSGGGYRAMVFHVGALWRLYEAGLLGGIKRISSVSGGSITAGLLALKWKKLSFDPARLAARFRPRGRRRRCAHSRARRSTPRRSSSAWLLPGRVSDRVAAAYEEHLFGGATLQDLPDAPRFVINATNVQSGALWRFMKPYMRDYRVGEVKNPTVPLARSGRRLVGVPAGALAGRAAARSERVHAQVRHGPAADAVHQQGDPVPTAASTTISASRRRGSATRPFWSAMAAARSQPEEEPKSDWARHAYRVLDLIDNQVRCAAQAAGDRLVQGRGARKGAYWGIRTDIADYELADCAALPARAHARAGGDADAARSAWTTHCRSG